VRLNRLALELAGVQVMIEPAPIEQFLVRAPLDVLVVMDDHHFIRSADGAESARMKRWAFVLEYRV